MKFKAPNKLKWNVAQKYATEIIAEMQSEEIVSEYDCEYLITLIAEAISEAKK